MEVEKLRVSATYQVGTEPGMGESMGSARSLEEQESEFLKKTVDNLKNTLATKEVEFMSEKSRLEDENNKLTGYLEHYESQLSKIQEDNKDD